VEKTTASKVVIGREFGKIQCRDILYYNKVVTYTCVLLTSGEHEVAVHREFGDGWTVRWRNKAEDDSKRQWERVGIDGMNWMLLPDKETAVGLGMELLRELSEGGGGVCLEAAVRSVVRGWDGNTGLGSWDVWKVETRERWMRKYGQTD